MKKNTAVVILNWNGRKMLERFLPSIVTHSKDVAQVIVADNASSDDSLQWLSDHFPSVRTIVLDQNYGFADGYNKALRQVDADYFMLLNSDVEVTAHWLEPLIAFLDEHDDVAAVQPKIRAVADNGAFEYAGAAGGFLDRLGYPFCRGRLFEVVEKDQGQYDTPLEIHWATGACMLVRASDFWTVDGFDGRFFAHNEEIDLCWRMRLAGKKIFCLPSTHVYHVGGGTLPKNNSRKTFLNFRNNLTMLYKNLPDDDLAAVMRWRWFLDRVAAMKMLLLEGHWADCKAVFQARRAFRQWRHEFRTASTSKVPSSSLASFSLLWQFYIRGRKHFSDLPV
ncbi:MAG: glycosyltransferase family 2 protein [Prevotella sp.]|nr:glycosyltransferase family 2 protein [Prevotella sp.]